MSNLTAAQYESKATTALGNAETTIHLAYAKGVAWTSIAGVYSFLAKEQERIDMEVDGSNPLTLSDKALNYRTKAEDQLKKAESWVNGFVLDPVEAAARADIAHKWAFLYGQTVRNENVEVS